MPHWGMSSELQRREDRFNSDLTRVVYYKKTTCSVTGGKFLPPTTKCYNFESNNRILVKFGGIAGNMIRKSMAFENSLKSYHVTLKFKVTWKEAFFKMSFHISGCICGRSREIVRDLELKVNG